MNDQLICVVNDVLKLPNMAFQFRPVSPDVRMGKKSNAEKIRLRQERKDLKKNEAVIYKLVDNKPVATKVVKGISNLVSTEIVSGVNEGDVIVMEDLTTKVPTKRRGP